MKYLLFKSNTSFPIFSPSTGVFPRDLRKKEKFLKHITGEATCVSLVLEFPVKSMRKSAFCEINVIGLAEAKIQDE